MTLLATAYLLSWRLRLEEHWMIQTVPLSMRVSHYFALSWRLWIKLLILTFSSNIFVSRSHHLSKDHLIDLASRKSRRRRRSSDGEAARAAGLWHRPQSVEQAVHEREVRRHRPEKVPTIQGGFVTGDGKDGN